MNKFGPKFMVGLGALFYALGSMAVDLMTVVEQAVGHDPQLAEARASYQAAQQSIPLARAKLLPRIDGGWGRTFNRVAMDEAPPYRYWQNGWSVELTQPVFDWSRWTTYQQADFTVARGGLEMAVAQQASVLRAARAYFEVLAAEDDVERTVKYMASIRTHLDRLSRLRAAGEATLIDWREAEVISEQAQLQHADALHEKDLKVRRLEQVTGQPFTALAPLAAAQALPAPVPLELEVWATRARTQGYPVQLKHLELEIAKLDISKARGEHYPVVNLTAGYTPAGPASGYAQATTTTTAMLTVSVPLFTGGESRARFRESRALEEKTQEGLLSASRDAEAAARESFLRLQWSGPRSERLVRLADNARETLDAIEQGFKVGERTGVDVLRGFDLLYASQRDVKRARYEALVTLLQLNADVGALNINQIAQINALLIVNRSGESTR